MSTDLATSSRLAGLLDEAAARIEGLQRAKSEPIAAIGIGCRFPGGADGPEAYWRLLQGAVDATGEIPVGRWDVDAYFDTDPHAAGTMYVRRGGFLAEVDGFDARFFEIAPREAASMDPQQRLLLEVAWEALEHAGLAPDRLSGSSSGVFVGLTTNDYGGLLLREGAAALDAYYSTGNSLNGAAGRIAHVLGLQGPCMVVDTACSSSLVAVHLACQSLRAGESDLALAGGANLILAPDNSVAICRARMLAADGRCKTFDAAADGYARAEGCGVIVLKRWSDAVAAGDRVLALIRGSAVNHDGASGGFTVPSGRAQEALIRRALSNARVEPAQIDYLEAHGTGTPLGDPIEVQAAAAALAGGRDPACPLLIGSAKTNLGHAEAAAGIAGLIKVVLALQHGEIPAHLHFSVPNPHIPWAGLPLEVVTERRPWPMRDGPRHAGVSSFGASGTNAHVVVQQAVPGLLSPPAEADRPLHLLALSARTRGALRTVARRYADHLEAHPHETWPDICFAANTGRAQLPVRAALVAANARDALPRLRALAAAVAGAGCATADAGATAAPPRPAFLFPGQGAQYEGMGRTLYDTEPIYRHAIDRCAEIVRDLLPIALTDAIHGNGGGRLDDTMYTQPALFAIGFALAELWRSWGVAPSAVAGHSVGEYVAACAAGVFSVEDGLRLVARRAVLMSRLPAGGAMAAIGTAAEVVAPWVARHAGEASIAALNTPQQTVISGTVHAVDAIVTALTASGVVARRLRVSHAFHSPLVEPMLAEFEHAARQVRYRPPQLPLVSNLTGQPAGPEVATPEYWVRHVRAPVQFAAGAATLARLGCDAYIEGGPGRTLLDLVRQCTPGTARPALGIAGLRPGANDWEVMLDGLGRLYECGQPVDWQGLDRNRRRARPALPTYPWQRERHWRPATGAAPAAQAQPTARDGADAELCYEVQWRPQPASSALDWGASQQLAASLQPRLVAVAQEHADAPYLGALAELERVSVGYVIDAWRALGWTFAPGERCRRDHLAATFGVVPGRRRLLDRSARMLEEAGVLRRIVDGAGDQWESLPVAAPTAPAARLERLLAACPGAEAEATLLGRCGPRLADVLAGREDPLALLFPDGDTTAASRLYRHAPGVQIMNRIAREAIGQGVGRLPVGRRLRVLEIGAGTGGTTAALLDALPAERTDYLCTDVSPRFMTAARAQFADRAFMRFKAFDIERDPAEQGFADEPAFDLIVAANVLHATRDLSVALRHARRLAAPGALLLLIEGTAPICTIDLIFGLTDGWWRFADDALRPDYPLIGAPEWIALLERSGFRDAASLALPDAQWGVLARQALIVARAAETAPSAAALPHWLVLTDRDGIGTRLAARHAARGGSSTMVRPGEAFDQAIATLDPARSLAVVHLWGLDEPALDAAHEAEPGQLGCSSAVALVRALAGAPRLPARTWFVTRGAVGGVRAPASSAGLAQAALWGLGRVITSEHPELHAARADLDPCASHDEAADVLWDEIDSDTPGGTPEDEVRWRGGQREVSRLVRSVEVAPRPVAFRADASYLITGGLGGLGLLTARWMAKHGARTLVLAGRSVGGDDAQRTIRELGAAGVRVIARQADVSRADEVRQLLEHIAAQLPPLRGVIHAAGVLDDGTLRQLDGSRFARVLRPKAGGAWHLHRLTAALELDCFVLYSSFTSVLGTPGQATHAAACAFLDALALHRRALGLPALSLDWGAWSGVGAAARQDVEERLKARGADALTPAQGFAALERIWHAASGQIAVAAVHWERLVAPWLRRPLLAELAPAAPCRVDAEADTDLPAQLRAASPRRRRALLADHVRAETARVLGLAGGEAIEPGQGFFELGMDSLTSVELRNRLAASLRCALPATIAFDHPNVEALADFVQGCIGSAPGTAAAAAHEDSSLAELSAVDIDRLIDELADPAR
ncbi:type I polyketide synthase [Variovorax sp. J22R115]|uniref:type I polyketide synthase n=1 Tax=Variovorax sp. J22R115 TaxID=3053509 RepID=UPI002576F90C|nr:type I polyketide synthase [Variovorax sp. J22R115]MDM0053601.1 type I polyketide synthase [Variovorax sp. J22R115]